MITSCHNNVTYLGYYIINGTSHHAPVLWELCMALGLAKVYAKWLIRAYNNYGIRYRVEVESPQVFFQLGEVLPDRYICLQPIWQPQPMVLKKKCNHRSISLNLLPFIL